MATISPVEIKQQIASLQEQILAAHPSMPVLLQEIDKILKADSDNITLLDEEDIGILVSGLKMQTKTEITAAIIKSPKKSGLKNISLDML